MSHRARTRIPLWPLPALLLGLLPAAAAAASPGASPHPSAAPDPHVRREVRVVRPGGRPLLVAGKRGFLGVDLLELTPELRRHFGADEDAGVLVAHVEAGSPAAGAGLAVGDVLVSIDGRPVKSSWSLRELIAPKKAGDVVGLEVLRDGGRQKLSATLVEREGRVLELGRWMQRGEGDGGETMLVLPDPKEWERLGEEMGRFGEEMGRWGEELGEQLGEEIGEAFSNPQVRARVAHELAEREQLQRKIELLERRLRDLEKRLDEQHRR
jgi:membrane-associated protease RseP (regulator of RpoE activity)